MGECCTVGAWDDPSAGCYLLHRSPRPGDRRVACHRGVEPPDIYADRAEQPDDRRRRGDGAAGASATWSTQHLGCDPRRAFIHPSTFAHPRDAERLPWPCRASSMRPRHGFSSRSTSGTDGGTCGSRLARRNQGRGSLFQLLGPRPSRGRSLQSVVPGGGRPPKLDTPSGVVCYKTVRSTRSNTRVKRWFG